MPQVNKIKRTSIMKIHGYISMFFLLPLLMYSITGIGYIFGYTGHVEYKEYPIELNAWPQTDTQAKALVPDLLKLIDKSAMPAPYAKNRSGDHSWRGLSEVVTLKKGKDGEPMVLVGQSDFYRQMFMVHKSHAGTAFDILGVASGIYLFIMMLTGLFLTVKTVILHRGAWVSTGLGLVSMVACYLIAIA